MFKIDGPNASPANEFQPADIGLGTPATRVTYEWLNAVQRELVAVIEGAGLTLDKADDAQLFQAIQAIGGGGGGGGGSAYWLGPVANTAALPTGQATGAVAKTLDNHRLYYYSGSAWTLLFDPATLALKADKTYVDAQLGTKVTAADVSNAISGKADISYVDAGDQAIATALSDRATTTYVDNKVAAVIPSQAGQAGKYLTTNGTALSFGTPTGGYQTAVVTANVNPAVNLTHYLTNTTASAFSVTLPAGAPGMRIKISDDRGTWDVNNLTIIPATGERIFPLTADVPLTCNVVRGWIELVWNTAGWSPNSLGSTTLSGGAVSNSFTSATFTPQASSPTYGRGVLWYDAADETMRYFNDSATGDSINIGQETVVRIRNTSGATITPGQVLRITGATGTRPTVGLAQANAFATAKVFCVATETIPNNSNGYGTISGLIKSLNLSAFTVGDELYLSPTTPGGLTRDRPVSPNYAQPIGAVADNSSTAGRLIVDFGGRRAIGYGTANQMLGMNAAGTAPEYKTAAQSRAAIFPDGFIQPPLSITGATTLASGNVYLANTSGGAFTVTLPSGTGAAVVTLVDGAESFGTNALTVAPATGQSIAGGAVNDTLTMDYKNANAAFYRVEGSTNWVIGYQDAALNSSGGGAGGLSPVAASANVSPAAVNTMYLANTTGGVITITLPGGTTAGVIGVLDAAEMFGTNRCIIAPATGQSIGSGAANDTLALNFKNANAVFYRAAGSTNWSVQYQMTGASGGGSGIGEVAVHATGSLTAVSGRSYAYNMTGAPYTLTLPGGTDEATIEFYDYLKAASATKTLTVVPAAGQSIDAQAAGDGIIFDYPGFNAELNRPSGSTVWYWQKQNVVLPQGGQIPGSNGLAATGEGFIGQIVVPTTPTFSVNLPISTLTNLITFTIPSAGLWEVEGFVQTGLGNSTGGTRLRFGLSTVSASLTAADVGEGYYDSPTYPNSGANLTSNLRRKIRTTGAQQIWFVATSSHSTGTPTCVDIHNNSLRATRIG